MELWKLDIGGHTEVLTIGGKYQGHLRYYDDHWVVLEEYDRTKHALAQAHIIAITQGRR